MIIKKASDSKSLKHETLVPAYCNPMLKFQLSTNTLAAQNKSEEHNYKYKIPIKTTILSHNSTNK